jgi:hypothetical protein
MNFDAFVRTIVFVTIVLRVFWLVPLLRRGEYRAAGVDYVRAEAPAAFWRELGAEAFTILVLVIAIFAVPAGHPLLGAFYVGAFVPQLARALVTGRVRRWFRDVRRSDRPVAYWSAVAFNIVAVACGVALLVFPEI